MIHSSRNTYNILNGIVSQFAIKTKCLDKREGGRAKSLSGNFNLLFQLGLKPLIE